MSTEYRRGIPSIAHVEAATRLGLLWQENDDSTWRWRFEIRNNELWLDFENPNGSPFTRTAPLSSRRICQPDFVIQALWRPVRSDGTPVDWDVLDQEVARVGQHGQPLVGRDADGSQFAINTDGSRSPLPAQPQGFRADLWQALSSYLTPGNGCGLLDTVRLDWRGFRVQNPFFTAEIGWPVGFNPTDILARWTVYQELKPLYDLVDGGEGEVAMPRDVVRAWWDRAPPTDCGNDHCPWSLRREDLGLVAQGPYRIHAGNARNAPLSNALENFAAVLDAVAERRAAERMQGQTQASTVTPAPAQPEPVLDEAALRSLILNLPNVASITSRIERGSRQRDRYIVRVQLVDPNIPLDRSLAARIPRNVHVHCEGRGDGGQRGVGGTASSIFSPLNREDAVAPHIQEPRRVNVEPRRFADVRPDRHGWRWWRCDGARLEFSENAVFREFNPLEKRWGDWNEWPVNYWRETKFFIPTDEQGNPVSWEAAGFAAEAVRGVQETVQRAAGDATPARSVGDIEWTVTGQTGTLRDVHTARIRQLDRFVAEAIQAGNTGGFSIESPTPPRPGQFSNNPAAPPLTPEGLLAAMQNYAVPGIHVTVGTGAKPVQTEAITTLPLPLPRFTTNELDDVDHSKTTKLDEVTLRRGKLPTVEQIAKYREVRAKRTGGTVADALKESCIDCEVAQYVLERWAGGLGDTQVRSLLGAVGCVAPLAGALPSALKTFDPTKDRVDHCAQHWLRNLNPIIDTAEKPSPTVQRERQEAEERRQRLAELQQRLAAERAAQPAEEVPATTSRFDLIEPDPQADPAASICAWEARQAAAKVRHTAAPSRIAKPAAALRRPTIEVVDAEVDGLSRSEAFAALFGRALNGGC